VKHRTLPSLGVVLLVLLGNARAHAAAPATPLSNEECAGAYEQAQEQRKSGRLVAARDTLQLCAREECPGFIRDDCSAWHAEVQAELPTLVFSATSGGRDLTEVHVAAEGRVLATRLEGQTIELDPGEYDLTFTAQGLRPQRENVVVARGERNRLVRVELAPLTPSVAPVAPVRIEPPPRSFTAPAVLAGVGLVGVGGFVALGAWGRSSESRLADTCSPRCASDDVASTRAKYVLADVSLGVGVASLALAAYTFFRGSPGPAPSSSSQGVGVQASSTDWRMTYGGRF
jgi:hypothetical protein